MTWGDCDTCINIDTPLCDECIHNESLEDHYEKATPEKIAQRKEEEKRQEKKRRRQIEEALCQDYIELELTQEFCEAFDRAKMFASQDPNMPRWMVVWAREEALMATNTYIMGEIYCLVPEVLRGKYIARIEPGRAAIATHYPDLCGMPLVFPANYAAIFDHKQEISNPNFSQITTRTERKDFWETREIITLTCSETEIYLDAQYYDTVLAALGDIHRLGYTDERSGVVFYSQLGRAVVMPLLKSCLGEARL